MKTILKILLKLALTLHSFSYKLISYLAIKYENGLHPKHRLMNYHQFFVDNISPNDTVLDIGCGNGALAYDVAKQVQRLVGVDIDEQLIEKAKKKHKLSNLEFLCCDATRDLGTEHFSVIILSNVLEHIEHRPEFLRNIKPLADKFLIRVPMIDREWVTLYKRELGMDYRLDTTHFTEFTFQSFTNELKQAGLRVESHCVQFGEIWAVVLPL